MGTEEPTEEELETQDEDALEIFASELGDLLIPDLRSRRLMWKAGRIRAMIDQIIAEC